MSSLTRAKDMGEPLRKPALIRYLKAVKAKLGNFVSRHNKVKLFQLKEACKLLIYKKDIGWNTYVDKTVQVLGWKALSIGHSCAISEGTWLNVNHRTPGHKHIVVGNNCYIGKRNFFSSGWQILVGDYCMTGIDCKLLGAGHVFHSPLVPYIDGGVTNESVIRLGVNVWLGVGVSVVGDVSIGHGSIIGAGALVNRSIPPFSIAIGNPCRVHKRFDFVLNRWVEAAEYIADHDSAMPDEARYLEMLKASHPRISMPLQAAGRSFGDMC